MRKHADPLAFRLDAGFAFDGELARTNRVVHVRADEFAAFDPGAIAVERHAHDFAYPAGDDEIAELFAGADKSETSRMRGAPRRVVMIYQPYRRMHF